MSENTVAGIHSVRSALKHGADQVATVWFDASRHDHRLKELLAEARKAGVTLQAVDKTQLDKMSANANHQGVVARVAVPAALGESELEDLLTNLDQPPLLLVLDGVQDPHNLGACLRSADAAGVHAVIAPRDRAVGLTPVACKVASGAAGRVPFVQVTNLSRTLSRLRDQFRIFVVGTSGEAKDSLYQADLRGPLALVMGAEENGMRRLTKEQCDQLVFLPMLGVVESLNVSVATGVCLYEALRQRGGN